MAHTHEWHSCEAPHAGSAFSDWVVCRICSFKLPMWHIFGDIRVSLQRMCYAINTALTK